MDYSTKMCPLLTAGLMKPPAPDAEGVVDASGGITAMACQGPACAWWMTIQNEKGIAVPGAGNCAMPLMAVAASQQNARDEAKSSIKKIVKG